MPVCRSIRLESNIGTVPCITQVFGALQRLSDARAFETERLDPSLVRRAANEYLGTGSNSAQLRELSSCPRTFTS